MPKGMEWGTAYLIAVGLLAMLFTVWDKSCARRQGSRVPERTLWLVALLGGSLPMYVAMLLMRHKTLRRRFMWGLPLLGAAQAVLVWALAPHVLAPIR